MRGLPGDARCLAALAPAANDLIVLKPRHSAFYATPLDVLLQHLSVNHLVLAGVSTESCVWMTACDAHIRGFGLIVSIRSQPWAGDGPWVAAVSHLTGRAYEEETVSRFRPLARRRFST